MENYSLILAKSPLFRHIKPEQIQAYLKDANVILNTYGKNDFVAIAGDPMEGIGIILNGKARLIRENMLGQRAIVTDLMPSDIFGEALLFTDLPLWPATIQTTERSVIMFIPFTVFTNPLPHHEILQSQLLVNLLHDLSEKALVLNRKVHYLTLKGMRDRIFAYLCEQYRIQKNLTLQLPHNRQEMADVLNVSRPSMSRELGLLEKEGILTLDGRTVTIVNSTFLHTNSEP